MFLDSHIHVDDLSAEEWEASRVAADPRWRGLCPGVTPAATCAAIERFADDPRVVFAVGWHPWHLPPPSPDAWDHVVRAAMEEVRAVVTGPSSQRVVALGETGLDHVRMPQGAQAQRAYAQAFFAAHLDLAASCDLPLIVHCVRAWGALIETIDAHRGPPLRGIVHAFAGSWETACALRARGWVLGVGPLLTQPNAHKLRDVVRRLPDDAWVLETDAPWMWPADPARRRGHADDVRYVAEAVAAARGVSEAEVDAASRETFRRVLRTNAR